MRCFACGIGGSVAAESRAYQGHLVRRRTCKACGSEWHTDERVIYGTLVRGRSAAPLIPNRKRFKILSRDGFRCRYCGANGEHVILEVDHVVPKSKGGSNSAENLITACDRCNNGRSNDQ